VAVADPCPSTHANTGTTSESTSGNPRSRSGWHVWTPRFPPFCAAGLPPALDVHALLEVGIHCKCKDFMLFEVVPCTGQCKL